MSTITAGPIAPEAIVVILCPFGVASVPALLIIPAAVAQATSLSNTSDSQFD